MAGQSAIFSSSSGGSSNCSRACAANTCQPKGFGDLGYRARVTAYSGDDGIDVILDGDDDKAVGVQVKRYKNRIEVDQIRSPGPGCQTRIRPWRSA